MAEKIQKFTINTEGGTSAVDYIDVPGGGGGAVADPNQQSYAPGSFTVATGKYVILVKSLQLTATQRAQAQGTSRVRIT